MKTAVDLATWPRKELFEFFTTLDEPFHGVCVRLDVTSAYSFAKASGISFFLYTVYAALTAAQSIEAFHYSVEDGNAFHYTRVDGGSTVDRPNGTFGFGYYTYAANLTDFITGAATEMTRVRSTNALERRPADSRFRFSALPWIDFTAVSHVRSFSRPDSSPRVTFGKMTEQNGRRTMPVSLHVHHALVDGLQLGQFIEAFQLQLKSL